MKNVLLLLVMLLMAGPCPATEQKMDKEQKPVNKQQEVRQEQRLNPDVQQQKKAPAWPRPYQPREEVSADSVVPFPVDI